MQIAESMRRKIEDALAPAQLEIIDDSHRHAGHAGHDGQGESHFRVRIVSEAFTGKSRVDRQRLVYDLLAAELKDRVHALSLTTQTPAESAKVPG
ncbi:MULTISPECIES: BolA family protein [unclassified Inquilinus]|uniref:BolA family protein n=1 Tax=unclassified Inquilinus TaxID=2645927 RepID=UPI003F90C42E